MRSPNLKPALEGLKPSTMEDLKNAMQARLTIGVGGQVTLTGHVNAIRGIVCETYECLLWSAIQRSVGQGVC